MRSRKCTDPDGSGALLSLWNCVEELSEIFHRRRKYYLIVGAGWHLKNRYSYDLADDLGINSDNMPKNSGLMYQPAVIVLHHL
jgi:hypothetical protein